MRTLSYVAAACLFVFGCTGPESSKEVDLGRDLMEPVSGCGDGVVDQNELCDDGNGVSEDGCTTECTFTCVVDATCDDLDPCNGTETCSGHVCKPGSAPPDGTACGAASACHGGACKVISCGDG